MRKKPDIFSGISHLVGAVMSVVAMVALVYIAVRHGSIWHVVSFAIFGASLILLYTASALYHLIPANEQLITVLRKLDHSMIFVLIAGSYTPYCLVALRGPWGYGMLVAIWSIALLGIVFKLFWLQAPRWLYTGFYLFMGWLVIVAIGPLVQNVPRGALVWLGLGGLSYTVGAILYGTKWPKLLPGVFGFHEIWHLFVIAGSAAHFWAVFRYVSRMS
ncbi:MAG TPA: hemolysin III family protein [Bacillota bacterium]|nr:hemolysin III family protein [Bacillota bacterium]